MEKLTNMKALEIVLAGGEITPEVREKLEKIYESFAKKKAYVRPSKPTAKQIANAETAEKILEFMRNDPARVMTISEMIREIPACDSMSSSKVSSILKMLYTSENPSIVRYEEKGKPHFKLVV